MGRMSHAQFQYWQIARLGTVPNGKFPEVEFKKGQYWKWVPVLEIGMPVPVLANCAFGHLHWDWFSSPVWHKGDQKHCLLVQILWLYRFILVPTYKVRSASANNQIWPFVSVTILQENVNR
jgi:hypothetical protein